MKKPAFFVVAASALLIMPANAASVVTFNNGSVGVFSNIDTATDTDSGGGSDNSSAPETTSASFEAKAIGTDATIKLRVKSSALAEWSSPNSGSVSLSSVFSGADTLNNPVTFTGESGSTYIFTTGPMAAVFSGRWGFSLSGSPNAEFLFIDYGAKATAAYRITEQVFGSEPFILFPGAGFGEMSFGSGRAGVLTQNLKPNTQYRMDFSSGLDLNSSVGSIVCCDGAVFDGSASSNFLMTWSIRPAPTVVPEPATWMMMILGFGLVARQLRRKRLTALA